jgi:hypothetical protein
MFIYLYDAENPRKSQENNKILNGKNENFKSECILFIQIAEGRAIRITTSKGQVTQIEF